MIKPKLAILLLAGEGKRLRPFTLSQPKCFARVGGVRILENALRALAQNGCRRAQLVVGYKADIIRREMKDEFSGVNITYVSNPEYQRSNSMYSLALGMRDVHEACWVIEGDVFFDPKILTLRAVGDIVWYVDSEARQLGGAYIKRGTDNIAEGLTIARDVGDIEPLYCKSIGVLNLSSRGLYLFRSWLEDAVKQGRQNDYYDLILRDNMDSKTVRTVDVAGCKWFEIDNFQDLALAEEKFSALPIQRGLAGQ